MVVSNDALSALDWFRIDTTAEGPGKTGYNDVVRWMYDALYKMNVEVDFIEHPARIWTGIRWSLFRHCMQPARQICSG